ncbi:MAG: uroporphyrinogen-III synthase [Methanosarcinales archaeon]|jgi:uroporphyrinogen-III synthase|nr:uroporphyrinogen-III synthase [Methanosarcinales archaeon]
MINKKTIAIMRPLSTMEKSISLANSFGFDIIAASMVEIVDMKDKKFKYFINSVIECKADFVIFTSVNGIKFTLCKLTNESRMKFIEGLKSTNVITIGPITKNALMKLGIKSTIPDNDNYSSEGLLKCLCKKVKDKTVFIARCFYGSKFFIPSLEKCGAICFETNVYSLDMPNGAAQKKLIQEAIFGNISIFPFTSSIMVHNFVKQIKNYDLNLNVKDVLQNSIVAAIGIPTADTLKQYGITVDIIPSKCTFEAMIEDIAKEMR